MATQESPQRRPRPATRLDFAPPEADSAASIASQIMEQVREYQAAQKLTTTLDEPTELLVPFEDLLVPVVDLLAPTADLLSAPSRDLLSGGMDLLKRSDLLRAPDLLRPPGMSLCGSTGDLLSGPPLEQRQHALKIVNRLVLVVPPLPASKPDLWFMPSSNYEDCFQPEPTAWRPGSAVDIDLAMASQLSMGLTTQGRVAELWAMELDNETDSLTGYTDVKWDERDVDIWPRIMTRYAELRDQLMDFPERMLDMPLARKNVLTHMAHWAGLKESEALLVGVRDFIDRSGDPNYRTHGMLAAAVDVIAWSRPDWISPVGGPEIFKWIRQLKALPYGWEVPRDNFFFHDFHRPTNGDTTGSGRALTAMRGEYAISRIRYVSAGGMMFDKAPWAVPGWRQCALLPNGYPRHVCGVDCYSERMQCGKHGQLLDGTIITDPVCSGCGDPDCGEMSSDPH